MQSITQLPPERQYRGRASLGTVRKITEARLPTEFGDFQIIGYRSLTSTEEFIALVKGVPRSDHASLVRIHSQGTSSTWHEQSYELQRVPITRS